MKKLLSLFATILLVAGCSSTGSGGGLFGGADCESKEARAFMEHATDKVLFAFDSSALSADATKALDTQVKWMQKHKKVNFVVQGHCDERGTREYNIALGERRANAVKQYLVSQGVDSSRITTVSYGKERPAVLGNNEAAWAQNRRGVTVVSSVN